MAIVLGCEAASRGAAFVLTPAAKKGRDHEGIGCGLTVILMGILQIFFGLMRWGKFIRMVPHTVMLGFVNGLAIVIGLAQLEQFQTRDANGHHHWITGAELDDSKVDDVEILR